MKAILSFLAAAVIVFGATGDAWARGGGRGGGSKSGGTSRSSSKHSSRGSGGAGTGSSSDDAVTQGYTRQNGTQVQSYHHSRANNEQQDNYSTKGNTNPYTGKSGTK